MSWQHRDYAQADYQTRGYRRPSYYGSGMSGFSVVTTIIIANAIVFFLTHMAGPQISTPLLEVGLMQAQAVLHGHVWRLFTATYLHASFGHILFNMLGLYFFGPALERVWGTRQFFLVYTLGGVFGNVLLTLAGLVGFINPLVFGLGASGSVLAMLGAAAVLFPNAQVYVYFMFPIRIRTFVLLYGAWFVWNILQKGANYGGDICHAGGLIVGLWWAYSGGLSLSGRHRTRVDPGSLLGSLFGRGAGRGRGSGAWERRMNERSEDAQMIDRILRKVREEGIGSLTPQEKDALAQASERRRREEEELRRRERM